MLHRFSCVIILLFVSTTLGVPQGRAQDTSASFVCQTSVLQLRRRRVYTRENRSQFPDIFGAGNSYG